MKRLQGLIAATLTTAVVLIGPALLLRWVGPAIASQSASLLPLIALGYGLLALNVTAHYTLIALGHVRVVTAVNLAGGVLMLVAMAALVPTHGVLGAAIARLGYGPITCLLYLPLLAILRNASPAIPHLAYPEAEQA